ncbi:MAG: tRNA (adenine(22)-N(1))-methyltransferase [Christensenellales bacterium]|jgi:tRNA (adenine22-N1)-methyltransferase
MSHRLESIVDMVPKAQTVADIGCDHGKVAISLVKKGKAKNVICSDISGKSLDKARKLVVLNQLDHSISLREGNGLKVLGDGEADVAVIAGMGGELIVVIMDADKEKVPDTLVLSCNNNAIIVRKWLCQNGYRIVNEDLIFENRHFYPIMLAEKGKTEQLSDMALEFGPVLLKNKPNILKYYIKRRIDRTKEIRARVLKAGTAKKDELLQEINKKLKDYEEVEKCL